MECPSRCLQLQPLCDVSVTHHNLRVGLVLAEAVEDDVGGDAHHAEDATLWAPADHLDGEGVLLHQVGCSTFTHLGLLKHFGGLQLVEHLQCDCVDRKGDASAGQTLNV